MMEDKTLNYDWHGEDRDSFLHWLLPVMVTPLEDGEAERIAELTDNFTDIRLGITLNGEEIDARMFMDRMKQSMDWGVERAAQEKLESIDALEKLTDFVSSVERAVQEQVNKIAAEHGIELWLD